MTDDQALTDFMTAHRRDFHRHPELGFQEERTKKVIAEQLREFGLDVHEGVGIVGVLRNGTGNRAIGLRADMDALPIAETSGLDYASATVGVMHACGHDGHMSMLLGAAMRIAETHRFDGTVVFIFQPNEEHGLGARAMLDEGLLTRFPVEEVYAIHNLPGAPLGEISTRPGGICAAESLFELEIVARGGHASMPHVGVDAILVGADLVQALQSIVARKLPPDSGAVVSVTEFITDGQRNVLPGRAVLKGDARTRTAADRDRVEALMRQIAAGVAATHDIEIAVDFRTEFVETINAPEPTEAVIRVARATVESVIADRPPMSFSEDFAHFANAVPGCFLLLGNGTEGHSGMPLHASDYDFNDDALLIGARFWTALVSDRLPERTANDV